MTYVVTRSCCADASCVVACPVNCIHPTPGEPGFAEAEMLYVDPRACVGCGACATACPVDAIRPEQALSEAERPFVGLNAEYYEVFPHGDRTPLALVPPQRRLRRPGPFRVAIVGAGPAGLYTADELLRHPEMTVDVYERLETPHGLVRFGVAPDHPDTRRAASLLTVIEQQPGFRYRLGIEVGRDVTHEQLAEAYHAVVYAVGAAYDRDLGIPGESLRGSLGSIDVVGWYNGHPDARDVPVSLDGGSGRAVVVGNGNVALDLARMLTCDPAGLAHTDVAAPALEALGRSTIREVVVVGRRGPQQAAFTVPELIGLVGLDGVNVTADAPDPTDRGSRGGRLLADLADRPIDPSLRTIRLSFLRSPVRVVGEHRVTGLELVRNRLVPGDSGSRAAATAETETLACDLVVRAIGFRGRPIPDLPYDPATGVVPSDRGRVRPGVYVAGWAKRGPTGFIGTNKSCAQETVDRILDDLDLDSDTGPGEAVTPGRAPRRYARVQSVVG